VAGLSITNVTTAHYVLALRCDLGRDFDDLDEVESVAPSVDSGELLELAAAIKTVVENRDGVALPDESQTRSSWPTALRTAARRSSRTSRRAARHAGDDGRRRMSQRREREPSSIRAARRVCTSMRSADVTLALGRWWRRVDEQRRRRSQPSAPGMSTRPGKISVPLPSADTK
jgi:hypothetical protein